MRLSRLVVIVCALAAPCLFSSNATAAKRKIWINEATEPWVKAKYRANMADAPIVDPAAIDPDDNGYLNDAILTTWIQTNVPANWTGPLVLDWESWTMEVIRRAPGETFPYTWTQPKFNAVLAAWRNRGVLLNINTHTYSATVKVTSQLRTTLLNENLRAINIAKQLRPNALVGMYGYPINIYWGDRLTQARALADWVRPILDASKALYPSVYDLYSPMMDPAFATADLEYVHDTVQVALEYANGRPVYPYVWPRYHDSTPGWGATSIPAAEVVAHVAAIFTAQSPTGKKADGIVYWGCDKWAFILYGYILPETPANARNYAIRRREFGEPVSLTQLQNKFNNLHWFNLRVLDYAVNNVAYNGTLPVPTGPLYASGGPGLDRTEVP